MQLIIGFFALIDYAVYSIAGEMFKIIFLISKVDIFTDEMIKPFTSRVYGILGVLILFKIVISAIEYLVNPDKMSDKNKGFGALLKRTIISVMLLALVPTIFSFAKKVQTTIADVIPKIVLGMEVDQGGSTLEQAGQWMSFQTLRSFINIKPEYKNIESANPIINFDTFKLNIDSGCGFLDSNACIYDYKWIFSVPVGLFFIYILLAIGIAIAIRSIKMGLLQLFAPIPISSYINSEENFKKWYQTAFKVYAELFVYLIIVYFVVFFMAKLAEGGIDTGDNVLVKIYIIVALLFFAKEAPKFICDILGIKSDGFGSIASMLKRAGGLVASPLAGIAAGIGSYKAKRDWGATRKSSVASALKNASSATVRGIYATSKGEKMSDVFANSRDKVLANANKKYEFISRNGGFGKNAIGRARIRAAESFASFAGVTTGAEQIGQEREHFQSLLSLKSNQKKNSLAKADALQGVSDVTKTMNATTIIRLSNGNTYANYDVYQSELEILSNKTNRTSDENARLTQLQNDGEEINRHISKITLKNGHTYGSYVEYLNELEGLSNIPFNDRNEEQKARLEQMAQDKDAVSKFMIASQSFIALTNPNLDEGNYSSIAADVIKTSRTGTPDQIKAFVTNIGGGSESIGNTILTKLINHEALSRDEAIRLNGYIAGDLEHDAQKGISDTTARARTIPNKSK